WAPSSIRSNMVIMSSVLTPKNAFLKQYEKFCTLLRNEICSNNLSDFGLRKSLENLNAVRTKCLAITDRFAGLQAQWLNVHVDFALLQRIALPIIIGSARYAGIKIHEARILRVLEVLLHGGNNLGGWTARQIHQVVLDHLPTLGQGLRLEPTSLRPSKAQRP